MIWQVLAVAAIAAGCGWVFTRLSREGAIRYGLVDKPDGRRKMQTRAIPLAGGIGVYLGTVAALLLALVLVPDAANVLGKDLRRAICLLIAGGVISLVGLADDASNLRARYKLMGQIVASLILIYPGNLVIERVGLLGFEVELGIMTVPFTLFWFLAAINAINLLDGMDGLLGSIGVVVLSALAGIAFIIGHQFAGLIAAAMAGSLIGFLRYNLPPATVYLGDCGSMLIGLVVAALAIEGAMKGPTVALVAPTAVLILPLFDTSAAILRRKLTGRSLAVPDRGHLHHVLMRGGMTIRRVLLLVATLGIVAAGGALLSVYMLNDLIALLSASAVVLILIFGGLFGNAEVRLLRERVYAILKSKTTNQQHVQLEVRLHGSAKWGDVWKEITYQADTLNLQTVCLDVNAPAWQEDYHVRWDRVGPQAPLFRMWKAEVPLFGLGQTVGRLTVIGPRDEVSISEKLLVLSQIVEMAERRVNEVAYESKNRLKSTTLTALPSQVEPMAAPA